MKIQKGSVGDWSCIGNQVLAGDKVIGSFSGDNAHEDARLAAAAKEMVDALQEALPQIEGPAHKKAAAAIISALGFSYPITDQILLLDD